MHPGASVNPDLDWDHRMNTEDPPQPAAPKKSELPGEYTLQLSPELTDESGSKYWTSTSLSQLLPKVESPKFVGQAHES